MGTGEPGGETKLLFQKHQEARHTAVYSILSLPCFWDQKLTHMDQQESLFLPSAEKSIGNIHFVFEENPLQLKNQAAQVTSLSQSFV